MIMLKGLFGTVGLRLNTSKSNFDTSVMYGLFGSETSATSISTDILVFANH